MASLWQFLFFTCSPWHVKLSCHPPLNADEWKKHVCGREQQSINVTHSEMEDLTHLCDRLLVCVCVCQSAGLCVICSHTWNWSVCFFFVFFFSSCSVAWQLSLCFGVPLCWWKWLSTTHTSHISPFFQNYHPFVSLSASQLLCLTFNLLAAQILVSPVDALCSWRWMCVCESKCKWRV